MRPALLRLGLAGLVGALTDLCGLALLATATWLITRAAQQPPITALSVAIVSVRAFAIGKGSLRYVERLVGHDAALRVLADLRTRIFAGLSRDPAATPSGDALSRLVSDVDGVQDALLRCALPAGVAVVISVATIGFTAIFAPAAALVVAGALLVAGLLLPLAGYLGARRYASRLAPVRGGYLSASLDVVHGSADLAAYGATGQALGRADDQARALAGNERRAGRVGSLVAALGVPVPGVAAIVVLAIVVHGGVNPVMVSVLALLALAAVEAVLPLGGAAVRYAELRPALARVRELLAEHPEQANQPESSTGAPESAATGSVGMRLVGVGLRYQSDREPALRDIDLELPAGRRVAVVGPSGSGKSSLLRLLAGVVAPSEGRLTIEGADDDPALRYRIVGGVLSDAHVFHANLRENLTLGRPAFTDADLLDALATAGYPSTAESLDRVVGEDGGTVSGGQRQRLLLARALLGAPDVLLMDEPTEGLDPAAADEVLAAVLRAAGQRSVVLVTHRLVDLGAFDEVIVLVDGVVSQRGRDEVLRAESGWYQRWHAAAALTEPGYVAASAPA